MIAAASLGITPEFASAWANADSKISIALILLSSEKISTTCSDELLCFIDFDMVGWFLTKVTHPRIGYKTLINFRSPGLHR
jgi:hypothetical protein